MEITPGASATISWMQADTFLYPSSSTDLYLTMSSGLLLIERTSTFWAPGIVDALGRVGYGIIVSIKIAKY
jgi:hypothetical protein